MAFDDFTFGSGVPILPMSQTGGGSSLGVTTAPDLEKLARELGVSVQELEGFLQGAPPPVTTEPAPAADPLRRVPIFTEKPQIDPDEIYQSTQKELNQPAPIVPVVVTPQNAPLAAPIKPATTPVQTTPQEELQALVQPTEPQADVTNQSLGIADDLQRSLTAPASNAPEKVQGLLTGADVPSVPISGPQDIDLSKAVVQPPAPVKPQFNLGQEAVQQGKQLLSGAVGNITSLPMKAGAMLSAAAALPAEKLGFEGPTNAARFLLNEANRMQEGADFATGASAEPQTPGQILARTIGRNVGPSAPFSAGMTVADLTSQAITPSPAAAAPTIDKPTAERLLFPNKPQQSTLPGPRVTHTIPTAGGPAQVSDGDLKLLGFMGVVSLGAIFAPSVISRIGRTPLPAFRDVANAAPGTKAISNRVDLARTYDDINAGLFRVARRAGVDPITLQNVQDTFRIQTGGAARNLVNSAVVNGEMQTPTFTFKTRTSVSDLAKADSPEFRDLLHAWDTADDILQKTNAIQNKGKNAVAQQAAIGPVTVRGMTMQDSLDLINNLQRAQPELKALAKEYRDIVQAMRNFNATGEYSIISKKELKKLNSESKGYVPWRDETGRARVFEEDVDRLSPFDALKEEMQISMRKRMENEATGLYIDQMRKVQPNLYTRVTPEQLRNNAHWQENTVSFYRRGKKEYYTTDPFLADVHNLDPYMVSGTIAQGLYASKRLMESTATGVLAPWFSVTSALRSYQIGKITTGEGLKPPSVIGITKAVPMQLYPQLAKSISESLNNGSGGWLGSVLGPQTMQALSTRLAKAYDDSFYAQLERVGTHQGSFLDHAAQYNAVLDKLSKMAQGNAKTFLTAYKQTLNAIHNSPSFDFASKNRVSHTLPKLAQEARNLTGDPMITGQFTVNGKKPIRMDKPLLGNETIGKAATASVQGYGFLTGVGREAVPWWNITTQGMKRIGQSYVNNPTKFVAKAWLYQAMPAAAAFMYTRGLGNDPTGKSYSDYQMNGRSEYNKLMNWYFPIPGRPAEDGIEIPRFHELAPVAHMMEVALDHMVRSSVFTTGEDFMRSALSLVGAPDAFPKENAGAIFSPGEDLRVAGSTFAETALVPPTPPIGNLFLGNQGMVAPQGVFGGGQAYKKKQDPYDQLGGLNTTTELMLRALGTGLADVIGAGYAAYTQTPEGVMKGVKNAMTEGSKRMVMKTPIARNMFDVLPPMSGNTRITEELFKKEKVINNLSRYYRTWDKAGGEINTKLASERGGMVVEKLLGGGPPTQSGGLHQPEPTNPLYLAFMEELYNKMNKDSPEKRVNPTTGNKSSGKNSVWVPDEEGGIGMKSLWRRYGDYSENLKRLRSINDGNNVTWQLQLSQRPEQLKYLQENNVDYKNPRSVRNFYEQKRQEVARQILFSIRAVEEDFSKRLGKPFHIEDLDPYAKGTSAGPDGSVIEQTPVIPPWYDGSGAP